MAKVSTVYLPTGSLTISQELDLLKNAALAVNFITLPAKYCWKDKDPFRDYFDAIFGFMSTAQHFWELISLQAFSL